MAVNKVVYGNETLIDLTNDTVVPEVLRRGYTAHKADGTVINGEQGILTFDDYPNEENFFHELQDSDGEMILDDSGRTIWSKTVYRKV